MGYCRRPTISVKALNETDNAEPIQHHVDIQAM